MAEPALVQIEHAGRMFGGGRTLFGAELPALHAVEDITLDVRRGETLGVVGESGCGKSTLARLIVGLDRPTTGRITFDGRDLAGVVRGKPIARRVQYVFQDPVTSLNPRKTVRAIIEAPLVYLLGLGRNERQVRLAELMEAVNLAPEFLDRYPHEFSGGQAQRIGIARALAAEPELIVLDEPVSALDVSVQAQVLNLLDELKQRFGLTYVFISHDLSVIESVSDRVAVMYFGRLAELGPARDLFARPAHPYTRLLLNSAPVLGRRALVPEYANAELPDPYNPPAGCPFHARCPRGTDICLRKYPDMEPVGPASAHLVACLHPH